MEETTFIFYEEWEYHAWYCGLDVHKHKLAVAMFSPTITESEGMKATIFSTDDEGLTRFWNFATKYRPLGFAMEATGIYHHLIFKLLSKKQESCDWDYEIVIVNPADASGLPGRAKNDKMDAMNLARYLASGLLKSGKFPVEAIEDLKALFRMVDKVTHGTTAHKNRIKKTLDRAGLRMKKFNLSNLWTLDFLHHFIQQAKPLGEFLEKAIQEDGVLHKQNYMITKNISKFAPYLKKSLTPTQRVLIRQELIDLNFKTVRKETLKVEIDALVEAYPSIRMHAQNLSSIPGISIFNAFWILAEIGDISRFKDSRKFLTYCGCAPRVVSSADKVYSAHAERHSNSYLRKIFYSAAVNICSVVKEESELKTYALRIYGRKAGFSKKLAFFTVASKVSRIAYSILRSRQPFSPSYSTNRGLRAPSDKGVYLSLSEKKLLRRARNCLKRINELDAHGELEILSEDSLYMIEALETLLSKA